MLLGITIEPYMLLGGGAAIFALIVFKFNDAKNQKTDIAPPAPDTPLPTPDTTSPEPAPIMPLEPLPPPENTGPSPQD